MSPKTFKMAFETLIGLAIAYQEELGAAQRIANDWFTSPVFLKPVIKSTLLGTLDSKLVVESLISMPGASGRFFTYDLMRCSDSKLEYICLIQEL